MVAGWEAQHQFAEKVVNRACGLASSVKAGQPPPKKKKKKGVPGARQSLNVPLTEQWGSVGPPMRQPLGTPVRVCIYVVYVVHVVHVVYMGEYHSIGNTHFVPFSPQKKGPGLIHEDRFWATSIYLAAQQILGVSARCSSKGRQGFQKEWKRCALRGESENRPQCPAAPPTSRLPRGFTDVLTTAAAAVAAAAAAWSSMAAWNTTVGESQLTRVTRASARSGNVVSREGPRQQLLRHAHGGSCWHTLIHPFARVKLHGTPLWEELGSDCEPADGEVEGGWSASRISGQSIATCCRRQITYHISLSDHEV